MSLGPPKMSRVHPYLVTALLLEECILPLHVLVNKHYHSKVWGHQGFFSFSCKHLIDYIKRLIHCYKIFRFQLILFFLGIFLCILNFFFSILLIVRNVSLATNKMISDALYDRKFYGTWKNVYSRIQWFRIQFRATFLELSLGPYPLLVYSTFKLSSCSLHFWDLPWGYFSSIISLRE